MADNINFLDPIEGLIGYVNDIKPFHSKITEIIVEYTSQENVNTVIREDLLLNINLDYSYNVPFNQTYIAMGGETVINTTIPVSTGIMFVGSPPVQTFNFIDTVVYRNGILQIEALGSPLVGDYIITGPNQITFLLPHTLDDVVNIYTATQLQDAPSSCTDHGFGAIGYDDPDKIPVLSPNPAVDLTNFPAMTANTFIVLGDKRNLFDSTKNLTLNIDSFIENVIADTTTPDASNTGNFTVANSTFSLGGANTVPHTTVFVLGITLVPPATPAAPSKYVSLVSTGNIPYTKVLGYSNTLTDQLPGSPLELFQDADEGRQITDIINVFQGSPSYFVIAGDFRSSNVFAGDSFSVINSTGNDANYIISSLVYNSFTNETTLNVSSIVSPLVDGSIQLEIPSNVFFINGNYTEYFKQGGKVEAISGSAPNLYTILNSKFINGETQIRVAEDIISGIGNNVSNLTAPNAIVVSGDQTPTFGGVSQLNLIASDKNNGIYNITSVVFAAGVTTIVVVEPLDLSDISGRIHAFVPGNLIFRTTGYGEIPIFCEDIPDTVLKVGIEDSLVVNVITSGSPAQALYQYVILNTTDTAGSPIGVNSITVHGDATVDIINGASLDIIHSNGVVNNDGTYTVSSIPVFNSTNNYTTFAIVEPINIIGNSGGWIEGLI